VIDYACGAGHFLTEGIEAINAVRRDNDNSWVEKHICGIEKDYRLARVSKISLFMNGAGGANIIFGDGLENYSEKSVESSRFDILVANPPYSVSGFKQHLKLRDNNFRLLDFISNNGNEIETLFVERIAQLLKPQGLAAIVLPASILSNATKSYIAAREELLKNFYIRGIVCFGSKTFGKTGTNTVTLFLEKYNEPPRIAELAKDSVASIMNGCNLEDFSDKQVLTDYVDNQGVTEQQYADFIERDMDWIDIYNIPYFKTYADEFAKQTITIPKNCTAEEEEAIRREKFYDFALAVEADKLYYFSLVRKQQTIIITAPLDNKAQKVFLGYDWTDRKGSEGIVINNPGGKLYNSDDRFARGTLACAIRNSFIEAETVLSEDLSEYVKTFNLKNLIDFSRCSFDKNIMTSVKDNIVLSSKFPLVKLVDLVNINEFDKNPTQTPEQEYVYVDIASIENGTGVISFTNVIKGKDAPSRARRYAKSGSTLISTVRPNLKAFAFLKEENTDAIYSTGLAILRSKDEKVILNELIYIYFMNLDVLMEQIIDKMPKGQYPSINKTDIESLQIPVPPMTIQKKIISECQKVNIEYDNSRMTIDEYRSRINEIFNKLEIVNKSKQGGVISLSSVCEYASDRVSAAEVKLSDYITTDNMLQDFEGIEEYSGDAISGNFIKYNEGDILISNIRPYLKKIWFADKSGGCSPDVLVLRVRDKEQFNPRFIYYTLRRQNFFDYVMKNVKGMKMPRGDKNSIMRYEIPMLSVQEQTEVIHQVEHYEGLIAECRAVINSRSNRIKEIIDSYLF
jgi:type I restriction-modification system DNA methylase subunit